MQNAAFLPSKGSIDWLRYTVAPQLGPARATPAHPAFEVSERTLTPLRFYDSVQALAVGRCDWHSQRPEQQLLVTLTGAECARATAEGVDLAGVLKHVLEGVSGRFTRLDFALDVYTPGADPMDVKRAWDAGQVRTAARTCGDVGMTGPGGVDLGRTVYLGSRTSERVLRVYDKARLEGVEGVWVRVELECKGDYAHALARSMLAQGVIPAGKTALRQFMTADVPWLTEAMNSEDVPMVPIEDKDTDRRRWYREQILPAVERDLARGPERQWLRWQLQRALDDTEQAAEHGPLPAPVPMNRKVARGIQTLVKREGMSRAELERAHQAGGDDVLLHLTRLGYMWDSERRQWERR